MNAGGEIIIIIRTRLLVVKAVRKVEKEMAVKVTVVAQILETLPISLRMAL